MSILKAGIKSAAKKSIKRDSKAVAKKIQREKAVDLGTPAGVDETKVLKGQSQATDQANMVRVGRAATGQRSKGVTKEYKAEEKRLKSNQEKRNKLASSLKAYKGKNPPIQKQIADLDEIIARQKNKLADMKKKNLIRRKEGGPMKKKKSTIKDVKQKPTPPADYTKSSGNRELEIKMGIVKQTDLDDLVNFNEGKKIPGSKVIKKMGGGKVYKRGHGGKAITSKMSGDELVQRCYDKSL